MLRLPLVIIRVLAEEVCTCFNAVPQPSDCVRQLYETDRKAFSNFRLVCKSCSNLSEYLLFRTVVIDHCIGLQSTQFTALAERLKSGNDTIRGHIRHLRIGPFEDEDNFDSIFLSAVHDVLQSIIRLQTLIWSMSYMPPPALLNLLNEKHPLACLHIQIRTRKFLEHKALFLTQERALFSTQETRKLQAHAASWEQLQRLDLQDMCWSRHLFESLTNRAPNLNYLKFYLLAGGGIPDSDHPILTNFIASIPSLHTLDVGAEYIESLTKILRIILQFFYNSSGSLKSLKISHVMPDYSGPIHYRPGMLCWEPEHYLEVLELTPGLERLDAQIAKQTFLGTWEGEKAWADAERKFKSAKKNGIRSPFSKKAQQSRQVLKFTR